MLNRSSKIVVITPIKNEEWILDRFLRVTSQFADHIIIADQNSMDGSVEICKKYPKVILIQNPSNQYDEASRQLLLLNTARELIPEQKIIFALDADEILAANATMTKGWHTMLSAQPGTVLFFEKEDLYPTPFQYVSYPMLFPLGYVDDGAEHNPRKIHSKRVPTPDVAIRLYVHDVKILHYTWLRVGNQAAKERMYSVKENLFKTNNLFNRRRSYNPKINHLADSLVQPVPKEWFDQWEKLGIDMTTIPSNKYYWQDFDILKNFQTYGTYRFWLEPIWEFDWEACRQFAKTQQVKDIPDFEIKKPPALIKPVMQGVDKLYWLLRSIFKSL
jgi:glycosyltransferase involved in cell wall biosynthesis